MYYVSSFSRTLLAESFLARLRVTFWLFWCHQGCYEVRLVKSFIMQLPKAHRWPTFTVGLILVSIFLGNQYKCFYFENHINSLTWIKLTCLCFQSRSLYKRVFYQRLNLRKWEGRKHQESAREDVPGKAGRGRRGRGRLLWSWEATRRWHICRSINFQPFGAWVST